MAMAYDLHDLALDELFAPVVAATAALTRLDERIARSPLSDGMVQRLHFHDAAASMWLEGELVHLEDLVLHDALMDTRLPSHALTVAHSILRLRRQITSRAATWALSRAGMQHLLGQDIDLTEKPTSPSSEPDGNDLREADPLLQDIDALLAHTDALLAGSARPEKVNKPAVKPRRERDGLIYEDDWDEQERLQQWQAQFAASEHLPPVLRAALMHDAWFSLEVLQRSGWIGRLLTAAFLRQSGVTGHYLPALSIGLRNKRPDDRRSPNRLVRLKTFLSALVEGAEISLKEHDRLLLASEQMNRKLSGRRSNSRLPQLIDMVINKPIISSLMVEKELKLTQPGALKLINELNLREITGRDRFRAWGIL